MPAPRHHSSALLLLISFLFLISIEDHWDQVHVNSEIRGGVEKYQPRVLQRLESATTMVNRCAHCNEPDSTQRPLIKRFFPPAQPGLDENEAIEICDAVKKIFEWRCNGKRRFKIEKRVQVCHECGTCLGKLYAALVSFEYLKKADSYINQGLLRDQAEADIQRYRDQVQRKSMGIGLQFNTEFNTPTTAVEKKPLVGVGGAVSDSKEPEPDYELVTPDTMDEDDPGEVDTYNDITMEDDVEGDPDWRRGAVVEKKGMLPN